MLCSGGEINMAASDRLQYVEEKGFFLFECSLGLPRALGSNPVELSIPVTNPRER